MSAVILPFAPIHKDHEDHSYDARLGYLNRMNIMATEIANVALIGHDRAIQEDTSPCDMAPEST